MAYSSEKGLNWAHLLSHGVNINTAALKKLIFTSLVFNIFRNVFIFADSNTLNSGNQVNLGNVFSDI